DLDGEHSVKDVESVVLVPVRVQRWPDQVAEGSDHEIESASCALTDREKPHLVAEHVQSVARAPSHYASLSHDTSKPAAFPIRRAALLPRSARALAFNRSWRGCL